MVVRKNPRAKAQRNEPAGGARSYIRGEYDTRKEDEGPDQGSAIGDEA
jgi:hypothetical protein